MMGGDFNFSFVEVQQDRTALHCSFDGDKFVSSVLGRDAA